MRRATGAMARRAALALGLWAACAPAGLAEAQLCDSAAARAARETGVPLDLLRTLSRVETGRGRDGRIDPWPWTLNVAGRGAWFDSRAEALAAAQAAIAGGRGSVDLGCFQLNHHWHGDAFGALSEMLDPLANARHAARFLVALEAEFGDWMTAAGAYHSRRPEHAARYLARVRRLHAEMAAPDPAPDPAPGSAPRRAPGVAGSGALPMPMQARPSIRGSAATPLPLRAARPIATAGLAPLWEGH